MTAPKPNTTDSELGHQIDAIIDKAERAARGDTSMYADMDNNPMNRQTIHREVSALIASKVREARIDELGKALEVQPTRGDLKLYLRERQRYLQSREQDKV